MTTTHQPSKALHITLWVIQVLLAAAFGMAGFMKITAPIADLQAGGMTFVHDYGENMVRFIGVSELLGALGLLLPSALRIQPKLTVFAAVGIAIIMVLAGIYHITHHEPFIATLVFFVLAAFVAYGRLKLVPIASK